MKAKTENQHFNPLYVRSQLDWLGVLMLKLQALRRSA
jgi:hypothetical protein